MHVWTSVLCPADSILQDPKPPPDNSTTFTPCSLKDLLEASKEAIEKPVNPNNTLPIIVVYQLDRLIELKDWEGDGKGKAYDTWVERYAAYSDALNASLLITLGRIRIKGFNCGCDAACRKKNRYDLHSNG